MWTIENRARYDCSQLRYPSDLTDVEWEIVGPFIPPAKRGGGKRKVDMREVINGLMYVLSTGCQWRAIPKDLPPKSTVYGYFDLWSYDGTLYRIHHRYEAAVRAAEGERDLCLVISRLEDFAAKVSEGLDKLDRSGQRDIVRALVRRIEVDGATIEIIFRVPPPNAPAGPGSPDKSRGSWEQCTAVR